MEKNTLFIIKSPFQAMCALEAISDFNLEGRYDMILMKDNHNKDMASAFLRDKGIVVEEVDERPKTKQLLSLLSSYKKKYDTCFVGNYYSYNMYCLALYTLKRGGRIKYLDDGTATLSLFLDKPFPRWFLRNEFLRRLKLRLDYIMLDIKRQLYGITQSLYTMYDVDSNNWHIEKNQLTSLKSEIGRDQSGIYIIGTRSSYHFNREDYIHLLDRSVEYALSLFPGQTVYYCPHRADDYHFDDFFEGKGINIFHTKVSVEIDFISQQVNPAMIIGYGSTALLTMRKIYPKANITSVEIETKATSVYEGYRRLAKRINEYYRSAGIEIKEWNQL